MTLLGMALSSPVWIGFPFLFSGHLGASVMCSILTALGLAGATLVMSMRENRRPAWLADVHPWTEEFAGALLSVSRRVDMPRSLVLLTRAIMDKPILSERLLCMSASDQVALMRLGAFLRRIEHTGAEMAVDGDGMELLCRAHEALGMDESVRDKTPPPLFVFSAS